MLPIADTPMFRTNWCAGIAALDFMIGFLLLFGGGNLAYHEESESPGVNQAMGVAFMLLGLALFFSALRIVRKRNPRFRPAAYILLAIASTGFFLYQYIKRSPPVSHQDVLAWVSVLTIVAGCIALQRVLTARNESSVCQRTK
jgi:drug/metabolite transporter (DMT)-like permease